MTLLTYLRSFERFIPAPPRKALAIEAFRILLPKSTNAVVPQGSPAYVVGFFCAPTGLGQGARLFFQEQKAQGKLVHAVDVSSLLHTPPLPELHDDQLLPLEVLPEHAGPGTVIIHANPPLFMAALWLVRKLLPGKRILAYWSWETENIPKSWIRCLDYLDEVLVPSEFVANAVRKYTKKSVQVHPHAVRAAGQLQKEKQKPFTVLYCCAFGSNFYRKNPLGVVNAFKTAFGESPEARLVLKVSEIEACPEGWRQLIKAANAPNIYFCLGSLNDQAMLALYAQADVYLSLHRSEGYGLTIKEALLHGLPVIATGWSGNMDFMKGEQCLVVPYTLVPVCDAQGAYTTDNAMWAEPDIGEAAKMLHEVKKLKTLRSAYA